jgi:hypothetical protein
MKGMKRVAKKIISYSSEISQLQDLEVREESLRK